MRKPSVTNAILNEMELGVKHEIPFQEGEHDKKMNTARNMIKYYNRTVDNERCFSIRTYFIKRKITIQRDK